MSIWVALADAWPCRYCQAPAWAADQEGPTHQCCKAWRAVIEAGFPCPACTAGSARLPRFLRDGVTPYKPDLEVSGALYPVPPKAARPLAGAA